MLTAGIATCLLPGLRKVSNAFDYIIVIAVVI